MPKRYKPEEKKPTERTLIIFKMKNDVGWRSTYVSFDENNEISFEWLEFVKWDDLDWWLDPMEVEE